MTVISLIQCFISCKRYCLVTFFQLSSKTFKAYISPYVSWTCLSLLLGILALVSVSEYITLNSTPHAELWLSQKKKKKPGRKDCALAAVPMSEPSLWGTGGMQLYKSPTKRRCKSKPKLLPCQSGHAAPGAGHPALHCLLPSQLLTTFFLFSW